MFLKPRFSTWRGQFFQLLWVHLPVGHVNDMVYRTLKHSRQAPPAWHLRLEKTEFKFFWSSHPRSKRGHSSNSRDVPPPEPWFRGTTYIGGFIQQPWCQRKIVATTFHKSLVRSLFPFSSNLVISCHLHHHPRIIDNEKVIVQSQSHGEVSNGMWALCAICH